MKGNQKQLTLSDRIIIEQGLNQGKTFFEIASTIGKDPSIISKEIRKHRTLKQHKIQHKMPKCTHFKTCSETHICKNTICFNKCNECTKCYPICPKYEPKHVVNYQNHLMYVIHVVVWLAALTIV